MQPDAMGFRMILESSITVGNIIEIGVIAVTGITALVSMRNTVSNMKADLTDMKSEIKKVGEVLVTLAVTGERLSNVEQDVRELRHGRGFVQRDINGEYPLP